MTAAGTLTMIDYGGSNLRSVQKAFEAVGTQVDVTADPAVVLKAQRLILPGVGAFKAGMAGLKQRGLDEAIREAAAGGVPLLGICLGMQLLFEQSSEMGRHEGLGLIPGQVIGFPGYGPPPVQPGEDLSEHLPQERLAPRDRRTGVLKIPHMGWNQVEHEGRHPLLDGVLSQSYAYFVHSFYCFPADPDSVIAWTEYGVRFASIVGHGRILGIQFHPEKSQQTGLRIIRNFAGLVFPDL